MSVDEETSGSILLRRQHAFADDIGDHVRAITGPRLQPDILDMTLYRAGRDIQFPGDFLRRKSECDKLENLGFPICKPDGA